MGGSQVGDTEQQQNDWGQGGSDMGGALEGGVVDALKGTGSRQITTSPGQDYGVPGGRFKGRNTSTWDLRGMGCWFGAQ